MQYLLKQFCAQLFKLALICILSAGAGTLLQPQNFPFSPNLDAQQTAATMRYKVSYLGFHVITYCALLYAAAESNETTIKFPADDGEIVDAILTPSPDAASRSTSEENAKKVTFTVCKP